MHIQLSDHFTYGKLLRFTLPSISMMIFTSIYSVVDGFFVSNFVGKTPFAAVNLIWPFLMLMGAFGIMFGTGGSALIAKTMGAGRMDKARELFSLLIAVSVGVGIAITTVGMLVLRPVAVLLGAEGELLENCLVYGRILLAAVPAFMLQMEFQSFFITAEKPQLGLRVTVLSGVINMVLDALLVAVFPLGLVGAALATALSQTAGGIIPLIYFARPNDSLLRLTRFRWDGAALWKTCTNGCSELMSNLSMSLVSMIYNLQLMRYAGEDGVAAYGVMMYISFVFTSAFIGYSIGSAPIVSYHYGAENKAELHSLLQKSLVIIAIGSVAMVAAGELLARPVSALFVGYDEALFALTLRGVVLFSFSFLFSGLAIFGSGFFTALNNGLVSAVISFLRTLVFQTAAVFLLPLVWEIDGVWASVIVAELAAAVLAGAFLLKMRKKYGY